MSTAETERPTTTAHGRAQEPTGQSSGLHELLGRIEQEDRLDPVVRIANPKAAQLDASSAGAVLRGEWLGHALHPMLTDIPIGCWTSSFILDLIGGRRSRTASQRLIAIGLLAVVPTAASGAVDWHQLPDQERRRVGVVHSVSNSIAAMLYFFSWRARRRGRHASGVLLGVAGGAAASVGGYLGGHLAYARSAGVGERGVDADVPPADAHALDGKIGA